MDDPAHASPLVSFDQGLRAEDDRQVEAFGVLAIRLGGEDRDAHIVGGDRRKPVVRFIDLTFNQS